MASARTEPALDLGRFSAYLRVAAAKAGLPTRPTLVARLVTTYRSAGGAGISEARVEMYTQLSLILMAVHSWQRLKADRVRLVCRVLARQSVAGPARRGLRLTVPKCAGDVRGPPSWVATGRGAAWTRRGGRR